MLLLPSSTPPLTRNPAPVGFSGEGAVGGHWGRKPIAPLAAGTVLAPRSDRVLSGDMNAKTEYVVEVVPSVIPGKFQWEIRQRGKLIQRSDRYFPSEEAARASGLEEVQRRVHGARS